MSTRLVTLATFDSAAEAHIAWNALRSTGNQAELNDENVVRMWWSGAIPLSGIKMTVTESNVRRLIENVGPLVGVDPNDDAPLTEEETDRQALETGTDEVELPRDKTDDCTEELHEGETTSEPIDREQAAWRTFMNDWLSMFLRPLEFVAFYIHLLAASGTGPPLSRLGRVRLFVAAAAVALALVLAIHLYAPSLGSF